jgi:hypothetical protein
MAIISGWVLIGLYIDGWAHTHIDSTLETFVTPWHGFLYTGLLAALVTLVATLVINHNKGYAWLRSLPTGYELSLLGAFLFGIGGGLDFWWHSVFGIEVSTEALLSPTHLLLAVSGGLIMTGPLRSIWRRKATPESWTQWLPLILSVLWLFSVLVFFTQYAHPVRNPYADHAYRVADERDGWIAGISGVVVQAVLMSSLILFVIRRWPALPVGSLTLLMTLNTLLIATQDDQYRFVLTGLLAGVAGDIVMMLLPPRTGRRRRLRLLATLVPMVYFLVYFLTIIFGDGTQWSIHLWAGCIFMAGLFGFLTSYLVIPPPDPQEQLEFI